MPETTPAPALTDEEAADMEVRLATHREAKMAEQRAALTSIVQPIHDVIEGGTFKADLVALRGIQPVEDEDLLQALIAYRTTAQHLQDTVARKAGTAGITDA